MSATLVINYELTRQCNLNCRYCHIIRASSCNQMEKAEMLACIDWISSLNRPVHVFLTGGEPLLSPHLNLWIAATKRISDLTVSISTNATMLTRDIVLRLAEGCIGMVLVSMDGWDEESHDWHSQSPGSFNAALSGLKLLIESPLREHVVTNTVLTHANIRQWRSIAQLLHGIGVRRVKFSPVLLPTRHKQFSNFALTSEDISIYKSIRHKLENVKNESYQLFDERMCDVLLQKPTQPMKCFAGKRFLFVRSDACVFPCWQTSDRQFAIRHEWNSEDDQIIPPKLYNLSVTENLGTVMKCHVPSFRDSVCLECCDAFNIYLNEAHAKGFVQDGPLDV